MSSPRQSHLRALLIGLVLVPVNVYWVTVAELRECVFLTLNPLFVTPVFYLFALACLNALLRRALPRCVMQPSELVIVYVMLVVSCTVATQDLLINLVSTMGYPAWMANQDTSGGSSLAYLPRHLFVWDHGALRGYFQGSSSFLERDVLAAWLVPCALWSVLIAALAAMSLSLAVILRRAWMDESRLSFPVARLPIALTEPDGSTLRSAWLWTGFAISAGLSLLNGLHQYMPSLPYIEVHQRVFTFADPPWNAVSPFVITLFPFVIGLAYLVPLDVSFSCWFFYLFIRAQYFVGANAGLNSIPGFPFETEQGMGAWSALGVALVFASRKYLADLIRGVRYHKDTSSDEVMPYRSALTLLLASMAVFTVFWTLAGMSPLWAAVILGVYLLLAVAITRVRAEAGGQHIVWQMEPMRIFSIIDSRWLGPGNLSAAASSHWYWRLSRAHFMPNFLESMKLASERGLRLRSLLVPIAAAFAVSLVSGWWSSLHVLYSDGALSRCRGFESWTATEAFGWLQSVVNTGHSTDPGRWAVVAGSAAFVFVLSFLRSVFVWFPLHPLGYAIAPGLALHWFPFFIAWTIKLLVLRYGGLSLYRRTVPLFLGLILGDYTMGAAWTLIGIATGYPTYRVY